MRIGDLAWLHVPVELYTSFAQRIRDLSPFPVTRVVGYTDGYFGYVADEAAHLLEVEGPQPLPIDAADPPRQRGLHAVHRVFPRSIGPRP